MTEINEQSESLAKVPFKRDFTPSRVTTFGNRYRYFILILGWLCLTSISSNMIALNFTLICMSPPAVEGISFVANYTQKDTYDSSLNHAPVFDYTARDKAMLQWSVAVGSMLGTFPFSWFYTRYGARHVLFAAGMISSFATALIPLAAVEGFNYFLALRFLQGVAYSADFAAMGVLCSRWASLKQNALFISVLTCYSPLSTTITNPIAGMICESRFGWPMVYYGHSVVCVILFSLWIYFYNDHPRVNQFVSDIELEKINRNKSEAHINMDRFIPYKAILTNRLVWVVWFNAFVDLFSGMFLLMYQPSYFKYVLNYSVEKTGFLGALPSLSHMPLKFLFGYCSDKLKCLSERNKMIIFNTVAVALPGVTYLVVGFVPQENPVYVVILFTCMHMFFSAGGGGFYKCGTLCARQYSHFVIANIQFVKCLTLFIGPALMSIFVTDETVQSQWTKIFLILAVALFIANILFCVEATDKPAEFTKYSRDEWKQMKRKHNLLKTEKENGDVSLEQQKKILICAA
ncbi:major facilitator superfamily domain-containing protein [Ditylenchus destructor]|uniref:Major facilitator superfamily domain-containing protein n=1 Tax=Ditylenchus destructor TaxID=166010 RepID=A0AAD4R8E7_9BILA|nr:major facilitator superfamily domain-containing protein [Ditylenchus destructor]